MKHGDIDRNQATYVGMDCHPSEHTAIAVNRFEEEKGRLTFANSWEGIKECLSWLQRIDAAPRNVIIGLEGRGGKGSGFLSSLLAIYEHVYEVNPQYTRQRRQFGTRGGKSDIHDARCIAEVVIRKLPELPLITTEYIATRILLLKKYVWQYEEETLCGARLKNHLWQLRREYTFSSDAAERMLIAQMIKEKEQARKRIAKKQGTLEKTLQELLAGYEENLTTVPGIGVILAAKIVAHTGSFKRFATVQKYLKYAGIAPLEKASGKNKKVVQNHKGNRLLNSTLHMVAINQLRHNPKASVYYNKKLSEGKTKKHAIRCVMKRITMIVYGMLKNGQAYRG